MIGDTLEKRVNRLENTCRYLEARIDGLLAALALMPGASEIAEKKLTNLLVV
jgi:hypothetical protein